LAHILIVDDDANTLASLSRAFRLAGHAATVCDNAARALDLIKSQPFDMLLSDVVMPGKDGLSLLEDLHNLGVLLPVVMVSGQANIEMAVRATRLGAVDFLEKPLSTDKLLLTVDNVLKLKRLEDENRELRQRACPWSCRPNSFACWRKARSSASAATAPSPSTSAPSSPRTATSTTS